MAVCEPALKHVPVLLVEQCVICAREVVIVPVKGEYVVLERREVLVPAEVCAWCDGAGCSACDQRGRRGVDRLGRGVAISERGFARWWVDGQPREKGEAIYPLHRCTT